MASLLRLWQQGFQEYHPGLQYANTLEGTASAIYGLDMRTADLAVMGRAIHPYERYGTFERSWLFPVEIEVATGSHLRARKSPAVAIVVHKDNPLTELTVHQLDGIFGAERLGGWKGLSWELQAARTAAENIRTWGQVGLKGKWADSPIHVYGPPLTGAGTITYFQARVLKGGAMWNEDLREYADRGRMMADLSRDPLGIAYGPLDAVAGDGNVKPVALAATEAGPFVALTRDTVADRSYPLSRPVYLCYTIDNERGELARPRVDPKVKEFLRYVLSRHGQEDTAREAVYLPLPPAVAREQMRTLESEEQPAERDL